MRRDRQTEAILEASDGLSTVGIIQERKPELVFLDVQMPELTGLEVIAELLRHRDRLRSPQPDTVETRLLQFLVEERRRTVDEKTRQSNRLTDCLKLYYLQILRWFDDVTTPVVGDLLERWPGLEQLQRAHPGTLNKFFKNITVVARNASKNASGDLPERFRYPGRSGAGSGAMTARGLAALVATLRSHIAALEKWIAELVLSHLDGALFGSLPGAGAALVPV